MWILGLKQLSGFDCKNKCLSWKGRKKKRKEKKQFNLFQRLILLPSELIKLLEYMQSHLF